MFRPFSTAESCYGSQITHQKTKPCTSSFHSSLINTLKKKKKLLSSYYLFYNKPLKFTQRFPQLFSKTSSPTYLVEFSNFHTHTQKPWFFKYSIMHFKTHISSCLHPTYKNQQKVAPASYPNSAIQKKKKPRHPFFFFFFDKILGIIQQIEDPTLQAQFI